MSGISGDARYEFRCWSDDLAAQKRRLDADWTFQGADDRPETYFIGGDPKFIVKAREAAFDVKQLVGEDGGLQQWTPQVKTAFPLSMDELAPWLEQAFGISGEATAGDETLGQEDLERLLIAHRAARVIRVHKARRRYELSGLLAEHTVVTLEGAKRSETVAVEGARCETVKTALGLLGIADMRNESYPIALARLTGAGA